AVRTADSSFHRPEADDSVKPVGDCSSNAVDPDVHTFPVPTLSSMTVCPAPKISRHRYVIGMKRTVSRRGRRTVQSYYGRSGGSGEVQWTRVATHEHRCLPRQSNKLFKRRRDRCTSTGIRGVGDGASQKFFTRAVGHDRGQRSFGPEPVSKSAVVLRSPKLCRPAP